MKRNLVCLILLLVVVKTPAQLYSKDSKMNNYAFFQALGTFYWLKGFDAFPYITSTSTIDEKSKKNTYNLYDCETGELVESDIDEANLGDKLKEHHTVEDSVINNRLKNEPNKDLSKFKDLKNSKDLDVLNAQASRLGSLANSGFDASAVGGGIPDQIVNGFVNFLIYCREKGN